ncbi:MAG TPA: ankyrin repeat domain-containing protein [Candidatus Acidoferrum sp.]|nr:ankyrin repeat domain-containing protein [Candidatus Acidoferrum sp.]
MPRRQRIKHPPAEDPKLWRLLQAIVNDHAEQITELLSVSPSLARQSVAIGATPKAAQNFFFEQIKHYVYAGDTPLHVAAAGYRAHIARELLRNRASVTATNRRGAAALHYAADGWADSPAWNPKAQAETIAVLLQAGANPNATDRSGVAPLHRAVRQRCPAAVEALLRGGASVRLKNGAGSTPLHLAVRNTGRGGTGSAESKQMQREIIELLLKAGADPRDRDGRGKTVAQRTQSEWIRHLL